MRRIRPSKPGSGGYVVGKGRPPKSTRWKPGQSGNPGGRPKGAKNLATIFKEALNQKFEIHEKGASRQITAREGIVRRLVHEALKGNLKATAFVLARETDLASATEPIEKITSDMSGNEAAKLYEMMLRRHPLP